MVPAMNVRLQVKYDLKSYEGWELCSGRQWKQDCGRQGDLWNTPWNIQVASAMLFIMPVWFSFLQRKAGPTTVLSGCLTQASTQRPLPYVSGYVSRLPILGMNAMPDCSLICFMINLLQGANPEALATIIRELRRESNAIQHNSQQWYWNSSELFLPICIKWNFGQLVKKKQHCSGPNWAKENFLKAWRIVDSSHDTGQ